MKIEDDLKLHSHYIEDLFVIRDETNREIDLVRARTHDMKEKIGIMAHAVNIQDDNIMKCLENQKELSKAISEMKEIINDMNCRTYSRFYLIEFAKDILNSPKTLLLLMALLVGGIITAELTIGFSKLLSHILGIG
jgi:Ni,Fe-hydrogenase I large subunit